VSILAAGRIPDTEASLLGALLIDGTALPRVRRIVTPSDFTVDWRRRAFAAMLALADAGLTVDATMVLSALRAAGDPRHDIEALLAGDAASVISPAGAEDYARDVAANAHRRAARASLADLDRALGGDGPVDPGPLLDHLRALGAVGFDSSPLLRKEGWGERIDAAFGTAASLATANLDEPDWIVEPWIAGGAILCIDGLPKSGGKTTLILRMIRACLDGAAFLGRPTKACPVVYLTEEPRSVFAAALKRAGLLGHPNLHILSRPDIVGAPWSEVVAAAKRLCERVGARVLVTDTFPPFAGLRGEAENSAGEVLAALDPLYELTAAGIGVVIARHERKSQGDPGTSGRGVYAHARLQEPGGFAYAEVQHARGCTGGVRRGVRT